MRRTCRESLRLHRLVMPTTAERHALAFLAGVALLGGGVRVWQQSHGDTSHRAQAVAVLAESVQAQLSAVDAARATKRSRNKPARSSANSSRGSTRSSAAAPKARAGGPVVPPERIDVDVATEEELERLPRIGPALASRIVANRDSLGAFGSLAELKRVRGVGPAMLTVLDPLVAFSRRPRSRD